MRGESGVADEGRVVGVPKFYSWGKCTMLLTNINSCRLDVQHFLRPVYDIIFYYGFASWDVILPSDVLGEL